MRAAIKEQEKATRAGLEFIQACANKSALEALCKEQKEEIQQVEATALKSKLFVFLAARVSVLM